MSRREGPEAELSGDAQGTGVVDAESTPVAAEERPPLGRTFGYLWGASGASNLGDGILLIGGPLLAVTVTRSPFLVSLVTAAIWLPWLLLALHAGAVADRYDRRRIMVAASWSRAVVLLAVGIVASVGELSIALLCAAVFVVGVAEVFSDTSAQSALPMVVAKSRLGDANGRLVAVQTVANNFLGAPLAGLLVGIAAGWVFGAAAACYALAGLMLLRVTGRFRPERTEAVTLREDIAEGLRYLWQHRLLRGLAASAGLINFANNGYMAVFVLWVVGPTSQVQMTAAQYGLFAAVTGAGAVIGSLLVERVTRRVGPATTLIAAVTLLAPLLAVPVLVPTIVAVGAAGFFMGVFGAAINVIVVSMRQRLVPTEVMGRVNASYRMIGMGGIPLGAVGGGVLGSLAGLAVALWVGIALLLVAALILLRHVSPTALAAAEKEAAARGL